ncbi:hypothetical protein DB30_01215 [Enhygromyxa salina]|uniref:Uncharacterized protein n=1 Tax=Enhygromyxa salina TaxID=215803 RepID=A0A0C2CMV9_9BACT|nr:hypothetical protein DB30_01215 [Enhygromyxa salina]
MNVELFDHDLAFLRTARWLLFMGRWRELEDPPKTLHE